ncbi:TauD/TfdA family dioxygenase [Actinomadura rayongensis]|uniref:TauD/TfdA family dioxygenase n=1 Tax=Actinomadura rayongensis TaxID=1429076 RepID=A0A6I4W4D1_9ACTN|nr:TauD/TfdA family dioxygenase [Actinomadura rayongensis]MXQ65539.1 TauD/TfdA family dioxygenase [Actinomadura rayongensis]
MVTAPNPGTALTDYLSARRAEVDAQLRTSGAVLFRGFPVRSAEDFQAAVRTFAPELLGYTYRSTPRSEESPGVYTSTEYPPAEEIPQHNENSYAHAWPGEVWFFCERAAARGGETPLADSRRVLDRLAPDLVARFADRGVMYVRNYRVGMDLPWEEVFQTSDRAAVAEFCDAAGIEYAWDGDDLRTSQVRPAVAEHPATGERVWFNQAHLFHPSALKKDVRDMLVELYGEDGLPRNARFGDGTAIPEADLAAIRAAYRAELVAAPWQQGDVLVVDNLLTSHGRRPFTPPRKVLVAMTG